MVGGWDSLSMNMMDGDRGYTTQIIQIYSKCICEDWSSGFGWSCFTFFDDFPGAIWSGCRSYGGYPYSVRGSQGSYDLGIKHGNFSQTWRFIERENPPELCFESLPCYPCSIAMFGYPKMTATMRLAGQTWLLFPIFNTPILASQSYCGFIPYIPYVYHGFWGVFNMKRW